MDGRGRRRWRELSGDGVKGAHRSRRIASYYAAGLPYAASGKSVIVSTRWGNSRWIFPIERWRRMRCRLEELDGAELL
ncbi:hypothetical protein CDL15_Pgr010059 [Punica granatum]|uniref:Uncharacterized protein n=1 Tax=Punica granatum TaxID=22663 RepID=A0A218X6E6_PUNGR|nr:hypothetical protein CDL15_Pgr010059 [Punica granatum]PKI73940.1 hypothetical protein CRG98_005665 [Punica granatum]